MYTPAHSTSQRARVDLLHVVPFIQIAQRDDRNFSRKQERRTACSVL